MIIKRMISVFLLGILTGTSLTGLLLGKQMDLIIHEKEELKVLYFETMERVNKLEDQSDKYHYQVVKEVVIEVNGEYSKMLDLSIHQAVTDITVDMLGREVQDINPHLLYRLLDERYLKVEDEGLYQLKVNWLVISDILIINLFYHKATF